VPGVGLCWLFLRQARTDPGTALIFSSIFLCVFAFGELVRGEHPSGVPRMMSPSQ
jgi:hypothetical protein